MVVHPVLLKCFILGRDYSYIMQNLVSMSKCTGLSVSQVEDEVLYTGLIEMQELDGPKV